MRTVRIYTYSLLIGIVALLIIACNKLDDTDQYEHFGSVHRIGVLESELTVPAAGGTVETIVSLTGGEMGWEFSTDAKWFTLKKGNTNEYGKKEETISIDVEPNTYYERKDTVFLTLSNMLTNQSSRKYVVIKQESALDPPAVAVDNSTLNFMADTEMQIITITTNQRHVEVTTEDDWIQTNLVDHMLEVTVTSNTTMAMRTGKISILAGDAPYTASVEVAVNQAKPDGEDEITIAGIELIKVKAGTFYMGAQNVNATQPNYFPGAASNQSPVHKVTISKDFYIGKYELTQQQFEGVMGTNPSQTKGARHPVEMVDWYTASEFVTKLSQSAGETFRLPTEAEWEYAARGGHLSKGFIYSGSNTPNLVAYYFETNEREKAVTIPVGSKAPNELGIYDMSGNVYEWCADEFQSYTATDRTDPFGKGGNNILRGGSWYHNAASQTVFYRGNNTATFSRAYLGFRVVYIPQ